MTTKNTNWDTSTQCVLHTQIQIYLPKQEEDTCQAMYLVEPGFIDLIDLKWMVHRWDIKKILREKGGQECSARMGAAAINSVLRDSLHMSSKTRVLLDSLHMRSNVK